MIRLLISCGCLLISAAAIDAAPPCGQANLKTKTSRVVKYLLGTHPDQYRSFGRKQYVSPEQPIHTPYEALNLYYYDRPYQYRQSQPQHDLPFPDQVLNESMNRIYQQSAVTHSPTTGPVDSLEFSRFPSQQRNARRP